MRCIHCGGLADPRVGGRPKCKACTVSLLLGMAVCICLFVIIVVRGGS